MRMLESYMNILYITLNFHVVTRQNKDKRGIFSMMVSRCDEMSKEESDSELIEKISGKR